MQQARQVLLELLVQLGLLGRRDLLDLQDPLVQRGYPEMLGLLEQRDLLVLPGQRVLPEQQVQ
ncbi:MAG: hypothetical protein WCJ41_19650 [Aestuariivirga sp.]|uniref:hypothetical protein n=1 Tax=Aestuariivirga sp. TaxID=2650926 RepID=UPI003016DB04